MQRSFPETLSALRRDKNISQRKAAADLNISQALLSHYENGTREPGLSFVCRASRYFGVSADYLLGLSDAAGRSVDRATLETLAAGLAELSERVKTALEETKA